MSSTTENKDSRQTSQTTNTVDWTICILCQKSTDESLQCPADTLRSDIDFGAGYQTLATNITQFHELGCLPLTLNLALLDEGGGIGQTLHHHKAKWHKSCRSKFSNLKLQRADKRKHTTRVDEGSSNTKKVTRQSSGAAAALTNDKCFFCGETSGELHEATTFNMDRRVRECALELQDTVLLAKLSAGDLIAQEVVYHSKCLVSLYNKVRRLHTENLHDTDDRKLHGIALAELIAYMDETRTESDDVSVFKLADLAKMYSDRLQQFGVTTSGRIHTTDLKNRILANFPDLQAHKHGRDVLLVFNDDIGLALKQACEHNFDDEGIILSRAANIVRRDIFNIKSTFNGTFEEKCQQESVSRSLLTLVGMILGGPNIQTQSSNVVEAQAALSISQLLQFNSTIRRRQGSTGTYHATQREPPLPIYLGFLIHARTRKRGLVDKLYDLGLSISYDRVLALSTELGNSVSVRFEAENVVCPPKLRQGLFTTSAVDNIDHNPSSTTAQGSLHGTAISLFQHPTVDFIGEDRHVVILDGTTTNRKTLAPLPESYADVPAIVLPKKEPAIPTLHDVTVDDCNVIEQAFAAENSWLELVKNEMETDSSQNAPMPWSAFHASKVESTPDLPLDISSMMPIFQEEAKSVAMIRHSMDVVKQAVEFLNPGQIPVLTCDQPLYTLAKLIQWNWPDMYGESSFVIVLGGLHIEMAIMKTIGDWLEGSGWTSAIVQAGIASTGTADSFLHASHVKRTRHAHEVTASVLYILIANAYSDYLANLDTDVEPMAFDIWRKQRESESPQFNYWSITLQFELAILIFVRSLREGDFQLYKDAITTLVPWFFSLNHPNYARWLTVHIRDMKSLECKHPAVSKEFKNGKFVVRKTHRAFSSMAIDQAHEQNNKNVKGDGGAVGLTENTSQLLRWMVSGPEICRIVNEFESSQDYVKRSQSKGPDIQHHEQAKCVQTRFKKQVNDLCATIEEMGNPFMEPSGDLLVLDTRDILDSSVAETVRQIQSAGKEQYKNFVRDRLESSTKSIYEPIKRNKFPLFSCPPARKLSSQKQQIASLRQNCSLFAQLYVSCQVRDGDLDSFFSHENQSSPPSLSQAGNMRFGCKSDLLHCLETLSPSKEDVPTVGALLLDGAVIINMLKPGVAKTFQQYSQQVFLPYVNGQLRNVTRIDIIWDEYLPDSLKSMTRIKRGKGVRRRVHADNRLPNNWQDFLRVDENKSELFAFLADQVMQIECEQQIISTKGKLVLSKIPISDSSHLHPCAHEEADTRLLLHAADCARQGYTKLMIRTVDTDVVVLAVANMEQLNVKELWVAFGVGKHFRYIAAHDIAKSLGPLKSKALPGFHTFTGCDQTSAFASKGKKTAWETWKSFQEATPAFQVLSCQSTSEMIRNVMPILERFVILMYDRTSNCVSVNHARKELFSHKGRSIDTIPPTADALHQHTKRAAFQAGYCWGQALIPEPQLPCASEWGWTKGSPETWEPLWSTLPQASDICQELLKCGCNVNIGCRGRCKCVKAEMPCTALCKCGGECDR